MLYCAACVCAPCMTGAIAYNTYITDEDNKNEEIIACGIKTDECRGVCGALCCMIFTEAGFQACTLSYLFNKAHSRDATDGGCGICCAACCCASCILTKTGEQVIKNNPDHWPHEDQPLTQPGQDNTME